MAKIPIRDDFAVAERALPGVQLSASGASAKASAAGRGETALGTGLLNAGNAGMAIQTALNDQNNLERTQAAYGEFQEKAQGWLTEARTSRTHARADGVTRDFDTWSDETVKSYADSLQNDAQRRAFQEMARRSRLAARHEIGTFELQEKRKTQAGVYAATNKISVSTGGTAETQQLAAQQLDALKRNVHAQAALLNMTDEERIVEEKVWTSAFHTVRVKSLLENDAQNAAAYFKANKAEISEEARERIDALLKVGDVRDKSLALSLELRGKPYATVEAELNTRWGRKEISADVRDAALQRIERDLQRAKTESAKSEGRVLASADEWILTNPGMSILDAPPELVARLKRDGKLFQAEMRSRQAGRVTSDPDTRMALNDMALNDTVKFMETPLDQYRFQLSPTDMERFQKMQQNSKLLGEESRLTSMLRGANASMGWKPSSEAATRFENYVREELDARRQEKKRPLTAPERRQVLDEALREVPGTGVNLFFGEPFKKRAYELGAQARSVPVAEAPAGKEAAIPESFRKKIAEEAAAQGLGALGEGDLRELYRRARLQGLEK